MTICQQLQNLALISCHPEQDIKTFWFRSTHAVHQCPKVEPVGGLNTKQIFMRNRNRIKQTHSSKTADNEIEKAKEFGRLSHIKLSYVDSNRIFRDARLWQIPKECPHQRRTTAFNLFDRETRRTDDLRPFSDQRHRRNSPGSLRSLER